MADGMFRDLPMMSPESWLGGHGGKTKEFQEELRNVMATWSKRYQEGVEASLRSFQAICSAGDPSTAFTTYQEWLASNVSRMTADLAMMQADLQRLMAIGGAGFTPNVTAEKPSPKSK
jgi:hypothetical protein